MQTTIVLYCSAMGYVHYSISCQCMTIIGCISYIMGQSNHGCGSVEVKFYGTAKVLIKHQYSTEAHAILNISEHKSCQYAKITILYHASCGLKIVLYMYH